MKKGIYLFLALLIVACSTDDNNNVDDTQAEWLYVHTAIEANATNSTTLVIPFTEDIFAFTDRPNREHKYISAEEFVSYWSEDATNSFQFDPPNAVFTSVSDDGVAEVEVVIVDASTDGDNITYTIQNPKLTENATFVDVSLFVDYNGGSNNAVYVGPNNIVMASAGAVNNEQGNIGNVIYTVVNLTTLKFLIEQGDDVTKVVPSLVTDMSELFKNNTTFNQDISSWDVSNVTNMRQMFDNTLFNQDLSNWDVDGVTNCFEFSNDSPNWELPEPNLPNCEPCSIYLDNNGVTIKACSGAVNGDTGEIDGITYTIVNEATLRTMIENDSILTNKVTTLVTDMSNMFDGATAFDQDISNWDVSSVTDMENMFNSSAFNQDIGDWDVSNVTTMYDMFYNSAFNQDIGDWDVSSVTSMWGMFTSSAFNQDISSWDVSNVTTMYQMFAQSAFNQDISTWDVSSVNDMENMFTSSSFNQPISSWDVSNVTNMGYMFFAATSFNQDLSSWSVDNVTSCVSFSTNAPLTEANTPNFTNCTP